MKLQTVRFIEKKLIDARLQEQQNSGGECGGENGDTTIDPLYFCILGHMQLLVNDFPKCNFHFVSIWWIKKKQNKKMN